jgi:hypothetical protein
MIYAINPTTIRVLDILPYFFLYCIFLETHVSSTVSASRINGRRKPTV